MTANKENGAVTRITCSDKSPLTYAARSSQVPGTGKPAAPSASAPTGGEDAEPGEEAVLEPGHLHGPGWNLTPSAASPAKPTPLKAASRTTTKMKDTRTRASPRGDPTPGIYAGRRTEASLRAWRTRWRWDRRLCGEIPQAVGEAVILHTFSLASGRKRCSRQFHSLVHGVLRPTGGEIQSFVSCPDKASGSYLRTLHHCQSDSVYYL